MLVSFFIAFFCFAMQARMQGGGVTGVVTPSPLNLTEVKFSGSTFGSCTTVTAQFSSFVHQCGCFTYRRLFNTHCETFPLLMPNVLQNVS